MTDLEALLETVMGRQWFQLFVQREVDSEMVRKRWGASVLEIFQVNRDMMDMEDEKIKERQAKEDRDNREMHLRDVDVNVACMSEEDGGSSASSGPKVFPKTEVVAGRRQRGGAPDAEEYEGVADAGREITGTEESEGAEQDMPVGAACGEESQQILQDTQLETMDVEGEEVAPGITGTTSSTEALREGSFGDGKVQSSLQGWLK